MNVISGSNWMNEMNGINGMNGIMGIRGVGGLVVFGKKSLSGGPGELAQEAQIVFAEEANIIHAVF